jgi:hypothetical protein
MSTATATTQACIVVSVVIVVSIFLWLHFYLLPQYLVDVLQSLFTDEVRTPSLPSPTPSASAVHFPFSCFSPPPPSLPPPMAGSGVRGRDGSDGYTDILFCARPHTARLRNKSGKQVVALTIDDAPTAACHAILEVLQEYESRRPSSSSPRMSLVTNILWTESLRTNTS